MLNDADLIAFVPTLDFKKARKFYEKTLGLKFVSEDQFALVFDAHGVTVRVVNVSGVKGFTPLPFTILGWRVQDVESTAKTLAKKGVRFERFPGMDQDASGIWSSPSGARIAWFRDPDGNILSIAS